MRSIAVSSFGIPRLPPLSSARRRGRSAALPRVESVAQGVAQKVGAEHDEADRKTRERSPATARCGRIPLPIPTACAPMRDAARGLRARETTALPRSGSSHQAGQCPARSAAPGYWEARAGTRSALRPCRSPSPTRRMAAPGATAWWSGRRGPKRGSARSQIAMIVFLSEGPREAVINNAMTSKGSDCSMSIRRWAAKSIQPPR